MNRSAAALYDDLVSDRIDPASFSHRDHIAAATEALKRAPFLDALARYGAALQRLTDRAGAPEKFNVTLTVALMSIIAEELRRSGDADISADALIDRAPALRDPHLIRRWWSDEEIRRPEARLAFLLPTQPPPKAD